MKVRSTVLFLMRDGDKADVHAWSLREHTDQNPTVEF